MKRGVFVIVFIVVAAALTVWLARRPPMEDYDKPVPLATLEREAQETCAEFHKRQADFERRFPTKDSKKSNDEVLNSAEWKELVRWQEGCDQAKAQMEEAKRGDQ
jgi:hypothetical protein